MDETGHLSDRAGQPLPTSALANNDGDERGGRVAPDDSAAPPSTGPSTACDGSKSSVKRHVRYSEEAVGGLGLPLPPNDDTSALSAKKDLPKWEGHGPDPFGGSDEDDGPSSHLSLGAAQTLSRSVSRGKFEKQEVTPYVIGVCIVAAFGGLLFGYSLAVTAGVAAMPVFVDTFFPASGEGAAPSPPPAPGSASSANVVEYCGAGNLQGIGFYTSSLFLAGAVASPLTHISSKYLGRRMSILIAGGAHLVGGILQTAAVDVSMLYIGRIFVGIGVAFSNQSVPVFLSEMSPPKLRGSLSLGFQFAVTIGILASQVLSYLMNELSAEYGWRYALALSCFPSVVVIVGGWFLPDTPNSLVARGKEEEGRRVLERIRGTDAVFVEFMDITDAVSSEHEQSWKQILRRDHRPQLWIAIIVPVIQQLTGANAVLFYAPLIFQTTGVDTSNALLSNVILGATNVGATIVAVIVVDRIGRRPLLIEGLLQMLLTLLVIAISFAVSDTAALPEQGLSSLLLAMVILYFCGYAWSWAGLAWIIPNEVQPLDSRSMGQAVAVCANFLATFVVGQTFPAMLCAMEWGVFLFFSVWVVLGALFTIGFIPETKGLGIEDIYFLFTGHWFWSRYFTDEQRKNVVLDSTTATNSLMNPAGRLSMVMSRTFTLNNRTSGSQAKSPKSVPHPAV